MSSGRLEPEHHRRPEAGRSLPFLVWRFDEPRRVLSSAPVGGGLGPRDWVLNAQVPAGYRRTDLDGHVAEVAATVGLAGQGVGLLTAADADHAWFGESDGVRVWATVGVHLPTWAAAPDEPDVARTPGTINIVADLPVAFADAALVNLALTMTEAKTQALLECEVDGTGTATDAVCLIALDEPATERFGGPRSTWGSRLGRAVHDAVTQGTRHSLQRIRREVEAGWR